MAEVATAFVSLVPSARDFGKQTESQVSGQMKRSGKRVGGLFTGALKKTAVGTMAAVGATAGMALFKGFGRLKGIDQAQAKLKGLGHDAQSVEKIMDNALVAVKGTAFGLDDAAGVAASAVAAGIKPGKELERTLTLVGDAATIAGSDMGSLGAIFNKVAASNKMQMDVVNQLHDAGIPALAAVADQLGVTAEEASKMASEGKVDFETFQKAMEKSLGGAAQESGKTFSGSMANMQAALGRLGAKILEPAFERAPAIIGKVTDALDRLGPYAESAADAIGRYGSAAVEKAIPVLAGIYETVKPLVELAWGKVESGANALRKLGKVDFSNIDTRALGQDLGKHLVDGILKSLGAMKDVGARILAEAKKVDWIGLGIKAGTYAIPFAVGLATGILNGLFEPELWKGIWEHLPEIILAALTIAFAPAKLIGGLAKVLAKIPFVGAFLARSVVWINQIGSRFTGFVGSLAKTFWEAFTKALGAVPGAGLVRAITKGLKKVPGAVRNWFQLLATRIGVWALDAFSAMGRGAGRAGAALLGWLRKLPGQILRAVGKLARLLFPQGSKLIDGLWQGALKLWGTVGKWFRERGERIKGYIGDLSGLLVDIGKSIIDGFLGGMRSAWDKGKGFVSGIAGWIAKNKGPIQKDRKLLIPAGVAIMAGFGKGLRDRFKKIKADVKKVAPEIMKAMKAGLKRVKRDIKSLSGDVDLFKSIRDQVKSAFSPDLFSGTLSDFLSGLSTQLASNKAVKAALPKLEKALGKGSDFLQSLLASGNSGLILGLAGADASALKGIQRDWNAMNSTAGDLGNRMARNEVGQGLKSMTNELKRLNKAVKRLDKGVGKEVGKAINRGSRKGKRNAKKG